MYSINLSNQWMRKQDILTEFIEQGYSMQVNRTDGGC
jgi:hypothetical protein